MTVSRICVNIYEHIYIAFFIIIIITDTVKRKNYTLKVKHSNLADKYIEKKVNPTYQQ